MDSEHARVYGADEYSQTSALTPPTLSEKDTLHTQLWKKRVAWLKLHPGAERVNEPVWRKMQSVFADMR